MNKRDKFNILSLFSGCGGLDCGFTQAGEESLDSTNSNGKWPSEEKFKVLWANDIFEPSCKSYAYNFDMSIYKNAGNSVDKNKVLLGDVNKVDFSNVVNDSRIDVILGGPPCQDFSIIRGKEKREGVNVKRGLLYCHFVRALVEKEPDAFVFENVSGLTSANDGLAYKQIKKDFKNLNNRWRKIGQDYKEQEGNDIIKSDTNVSYNLIFSDVVDFSKLGVPQARKRLIIIGIKNEVVERMDEKKFDNYKKSLKNTLGEKNVLLEKYPLTPIETFNGKPLNRLDSEYKNIMKPYEESIEKIESKRKEKYKKEIQSKYSYKILQDYKKINDIKSVNSNLLSLLHKSRLKELGYYNQPLSKKNFQDDSNQIMNEMDKIKKRMELIPPDENHKFVKNTKHSVKAMMSNIYKRIHPIKPAYTVIARGGGGTWGYHYKINRQRMTNRERARLQAFPDNFKFEGKNGQVRRQIGEAVPPLASKKIAEKLLPILDA